ncbi:hypothetical protein QE417_003484 [Mucilaginibacter terrae]|uniref:Transposase n=1 Tax=Mucilaginibacter terrae TaxID=1955052 RepID=A0ABU3GXB8_9SPHI|nr:hypothetical protein [Mucilaginibacter terrae]
MIVLSEMIEQDKSNFDDISMTHLPNRWLFDS